MGEDMKTVELQQVTSIIAGQSPESLTYNSTADGLPFFQGKADFQEKFPKVRVWCNSVKRKEAEPGDILMSVRAPVGSVNICNQKCIIGRGLSAIRSHSNLNNYFLYYYLKCNEKKVASLGTGSTFQAITQTTLKRLEIPLPPLDDQIRIATLLSKVENLISRRREQLKQLDELLKSVFLEMFGDPISNPKRFPVKLLSEFYIKPKNGTKCGPFGSALKKNELVESGIPVWNMDNISPSGRMILPFRMWVTEEKFQELRSYSVIDGDIIISRAGTVGKMCVAKMDCVPAIISTNLIRVRLGSLLLPRHIISLMTYCRGRVGRLKTGADGTFTHMNTGILDKLEFPYPPLELQRKFAEIFEKVESIKIQYQRSLFKMEHLYGTISQKAFKGALDLSRVPVVEEGEPVI